MGKTKKGKKEVVNGNESNPNLVDDESETEEIVAKPNIKKASKIKKAEGFGLLIDDDNSDDDVQITQAADVQSDEEENNANQKSTQKPNKKSKKDKKKSKRNDSDEDIEKMLADLELEYSGKQPAASSDRSKPAEKATENDENDANDTESTMKSAAQKKKEKKERQKREAALLKQQQKQQTDGSAEGVAEGGDDEQPPAEPTAPTKKEKSKKKEKETKTQDTVEVADVEVANDEEETPADKKKKKKTKGDKEKKEDEKDKKKKGPNAAMVAAMQERLQKIKEEEERQKQLEEERIVREEELERLRLENIRIEAEQKEKKKLREKERKARLKAEGKLLTQKQKLGQARAQAMLESLRAQGVELPEAGAGKKPRPGTRVRPNKKTQQQNITEQASEDMSEADTKETPTESPERDEPEEEEEEKVKDAWDDSSEEDEPQPGKTTGSNQKATASRNAKSSPADDDSESESSDDEDDDDESDDSSSSDADEGKTDAEIRKEKAWQRIMKRQHAAEQKRTTDNLRAAVICVLGHVDTGKTKILDKLRRTNVQDGEAGGITQQIGATNVPIDAIKEQCKPVKGSSEMNYKLPGLLIIDTPGHESFSNLRNRGSSLCDMAILVVDIMHGLEPQTIESINILRSRKIPFVVALNKIDRLYDWNTMNRRDVQDILKSQTIHTVEEFKKRTNEVISQFAEQRLNAALYYENPDPRSYVNLVPTSAITGEGMGNLLYLIVNACQTLLAKRLMYSEELLATVLEVKAIAGLSTTIDCILINGKLREGDTIVIAGTDGPITTQIRSLLMPHPMKELRVKNEYVEYKEVMGAQGVKIAAKELEKAIAGLNVYVAQKNDEVDYCRDEVTKELRTALSHIKLSQEGVYVQASTLGSLEALLEFLKTSKIPYANIRIGPVVRRDVMIASTMLAHEASYATILAFDVKVEREAQELADSKGVKIFQADIIYHLFDKFTAYREELKQKKREEFKNIAVFPCKLKILPQYIFNSRDPIVMGVIVENGIVKEGTPICVPSKEFLEIGVVTSIECNHKQVESARKGQEICIKIEPIPGESPKMFGRHFEETDMLVSKISRQSIDACKDYFRDDLIKADWGLMVELKKLFQIL